MAPIIHEESGLTEMQQQISEIVQHGVIDPNFTFSNAEFELLSTLRYDPGFTTANSSTIRNETSGDFTRFGLQLDAVVDPQLSDLDLQGSFAGDSPIDNGRSLLESFQGLQRGIPPMSPPPEPEDEPTCDKSEDELLEVFYNRFLLLGEHIQRLRLGLRFFGWGFDISLPLLLEKLILGIPCPMDAATNLHTRMKSLFYANTKYKMRVLVSHAGVLRIEAHEIPQALDYFSTPTQYFISTVLNGFLASPEEIWDVFIDSQTTTASPFTTFKTTRRGHYNDARARMEEMRAVIEKPAAKAEILIYNNTFELMEGSITNVAVLRSGNSESSFYYQTPYLSTGCLCGVMRYYLLKKKLINEGSIDVRQLKVGDHLLLFNGVMGCVRGVVRNSLE
ncbi:LADA_0B01816g1_1 [Lachancea dasiensis]|uniref:LADA_0B01816g1_1 n=1 Tax=Lachancea dasiensis TaxID=1072105 RepID=A0A1G4IRV8_9SACH|nr:LADA_0B01816g1_1 [Lachancea dasiensis]